MYVPKSQIVTNLYTNGGEYVVESTKQEYIGFYYKLSTGEIFTGKNPNDSNIRSLIPLNVPTTEPSPTTTTRISGLGVDPDPIGGEDLAKPWNTYNYLKSRQQDTLDPQIKFVPTYSYPKVTGDDYDIGSFVRYFAKKANQNLYIEINKTQYNSLKNKEDNWDYSSYQIFTITWTLEGPSPEEVSNINKNVVATVERQQRITGLLNYFKDYSQFYRA
jgi:hypothetical protein